MKKGWALAVEKVIWLDDGMDSRGGRDGCRWVEGFGLGMCIWDLRDLWNLDVRRRKRRRIRSKLLVSLVFISRSMFGFAL